MFRESLSPPSFALHLLATVLAFAWVWRLPETASRQQSAARSPMLRLTAFVDAPGPLVRQRDFAVLGDHRAGDFDPALGPGGAWLVDVFGPVGDAGD